MIYTINLTKSAARDYKEIKEPYRTNITKHIESLKQQGLNNTNIKMLTGEFAGMYRLRVGNYRIIFEIDDKFITIIAILHRKEVYKQR